jgi:hypothetical protein
MNLERITINIAGIPGTPESVRINLKYGLRYKGNDILM